MRKKKKKKKTDRKKERCVVKREGVLERGKKRERKQKKDTYVRGLHINGITTSLCVQQ